MRAVGITAFGGRERLEQLDLPTPEAGAGEVRIRVAAAGVNPVDYKIREGYLTEMLPHVFPVVLGWDCAGVIDAVGEGVEGLAVGDEVYAYARKPTVQWGTYAEQTVVEAKHVAKKPTALDAVKASSVPLAALTALQSLDAGRLAAGETIVVHAAAGGVGGFAVQLAKIRGAHVIGTASAANHDYLRSLGCDEVVDYRSEDVTAAVRAKHPSGVNMVFDCVGGEVLTESPKLLAEAGRLVTIVDFDAIEALVAAGVDAQAVFVEPSGSQLAQLAEWFDAGKLQTNVSTVLPLAEAAQAHELSESRRTQGKIVLTIER